MEKQKGGVQMNLSGSTPVAFVSVTDRERALSFYLDTLGLKLRSTDENGDFVELGSALLRMTRVDDHQAHGHPVLGWNVDDLVAAVRDLRSRGVEFTIFEGAGQDELGIWTSPDGSTQVAFFADPDGNVLTVSRA
jgi:catechol 2,3-dioxygenase-like lactoylglutathione lyase family enzyme